MHTLKKHSHLALIFVGTLFFAHAAIAATDTTAQQSYAKALAKNHGQDVDHSAHENHDKSLDFHGIFYGYLPCNDCNGIKTTLSLKQNKNYLLVTQPAKDSSREYYEKGKYSWDEENHALVLTPRNEADNTRYYRIKDEGTLILLNSDGSEMSKELEDGYTLRRSDMVKGREVHIH